LAEQGRTTLLAFLTLSSITVAAPAWGEDGNRLAIEVGAPVYQDLDGPQLETDLVLVLGWQLLR